MKAVIRLLLICFISALALSFVSVKAAWAAGNIESILLSSHNWEASGSSLKINKDGSYLYSFGSPGLIQEQSGKIDQKQLEELMRLVGGSDLSGLKDKYSSLPFSRLGQTYYLNIVTSSGSKAVEFYLHNQDERAQDKVPQILIDIADKINIIKSQIKNCVSK